jgi:hypothetical protein
MPVLVPGLDDRSSSVGDLGGGSGEESRSPTRPRLGPRLRTSCLPQRHGHGPGLCSTASRRDAPAAAVRNAPGEAAAVGLARGCRVRNAPGEGRAHLHSYGQQLFQAN